MSELIAIIGRPNVGKSTIFNRLVRDRKAVISDVPGTTRDKIYGTCEIKGKKVQVIDTGGIAKAMKGDLIDIGIQAQTNIAIAESNVIILVLDGESGLFQEDMKILKDLYKQTKKFLVVVNKCDSPKIEQRVTDTFKKLQNNYIMISAKNGLGLLDLRRFIAKHIDLASLPNAQEEHDEIYGDETEEELELKLVPKKSDEIQISIIGKPNVGKSSLINVLAEKEISIVSPIAGTTRDSVDTEILYKDRKIRIIDTAGLRRKNKIEDHIEYYSYLRSLKSITGSDIVVLVLDANKLVSHYEKTLLNYIAEEKKGIILVINKWDLVPKDTHTMTEYTKYLRAAIPFFKWIPIIYTSASSKQRIYEIFEQAIEIDFERSKKIDTNTLNSLMQELKIKHPPAALHHKKKRPKLYYATQTETNPPLFRIYVSDPKNVHSSYIRYLENRLRELYGFNGTPISIVMYKSV